MKTFIRDLSVLLGLALFVAGCSLAWLPLGPIVAGLAIAAAGIFSQIVHEKKRIEEKAEAEREVKMRIIREGL
jgi:hypothetical protein